MPDVVHSYGLGEATHSHVRCMSSYLQYSSLMYVNFRDKKCDILREIVAYLEFYILASVNLV